MEHLCPYLCANSVIMVESISVSMANSIDFLIQYSTETTHVPEFEYVSQCVEMSVSQCPLKGEGMIQCHQAENMPMACNATI